MCSWNVPSAQGGKCSEYKLLVSWIYPESFIKLPVEIVKMLELSNDPVVALFCSGHMNHFIITHSIKYSRLFCPSRLVVLKLKPHLVEKDLGRNPPVGILFWRDLSAPPHSSTSPSPQTPGYLHSCNPLIWQNISSRLVSPLSLYSI